MMKVGESMIAIPQTYNYHREHEYEIQEEQILHLARVGLFPEYFDAADDLARDWLDKHNDQLCDIVDARVLPFRPFTKEEQAHDLLVRQGKLDEPMTLPVGPDPVKRINLKRLVRKSAAPAPEAPKGRKPMSPEAKQAMLDRLAKARAAKKVAVKV